MKKNKEIWKNVPGYEELYQVSSLGRVKSLRRNKIMKLTLGNCKYYQIGFVKNGKQKRFLVHRLILLTFKGYSTLYVNHKDGNKLNNNLDNLEYCTRKENAEHASKNGLYRKGTKHANSKFNKKEIKDIKTLLNSGVKGSDIARKYNVTRQCISLIKLNLSYKND